MMSSPRPWRLVATVAGFLVLLGLLAGCADQCDQQKKVDRLTDELVMANLWAQSSAEYDAACLQAFSLARRNLDDKLAAHDGDRPVAVIVDCDDTVISSARYGAWMIANGRSYDHPSWAQWLKEDPAREVPGAGDFLRYAASKGVDVFYVTNRRDEDEAATLAQLEHLEYPNADQDHLLDKSETSDKTPRREQVASTHDVLLLVGDALTDFDQMYSGGTIESRAKAVADNAAMFGDRYIVIPNPVYGEWEDILYNGDRSMPRDEKVAKRLDALHPWQPGLAQE